MGGFGIGALIFVVLILAVPVLFFLGLPDLSGVRWGNEHAALERRMLDELEVLHLRLDMITKRLDDAGIPSPPEEPLLPRDS